MVQRLIPAPGGGYGYSQVFFGPVLTYKLIQSTRTQAGFKGYIFSGRIAGGNTLYGEIPPYKCERGHYTTTNSAEIKPPA